MNKNETIFEEVRNIIRQGNLTLESYTHLNNKLKGVVSKSITKTCKVCKHQSIDYSETFYSPEDRWDALLNIPHRGSRKEEFKDSYDYVPSHIDTIFEAIDNLDLKSGDIIYDIGAGCGRAALFFAMFTKAKVKGIERFEDYVKIAQTAAQNLHIKNIEFICGDALDHNYSDANKFFMYTPFYGKKLESFLKNNLLKLAKKKDFQLVFHGPMPEPLNNSPFLIKKIRKNYKNLYTLNPYFVELYHKKEAQNV